MLQVCAQSLLKIWATGLLDEKAYLDSLETIVNNAFLKVHCTCAQQYYIAMRVFYFTEFQLEKDLENGIIREEFILWGCERFKESRTIANAESLVAIYNSPHIL